MEVTKQKPSLVSMSVKEAIALGARDIPTFGQIWFPRTFRQASPEFHYEMSHTLEDSANRLIGFMVFRDGAKTTLCRAYVAKRIAYCISRTVMLVNISGAKAQHSLRWLKKQIEFNAPFREAFGLRKGEKWTDEWITIINSQGESVNVVATGITAGLRGLNIDDYRPDLILCDDISDRENTATEDQRAKANEAFFAQLVRSLAPASDAPMSQLALAQTPINSFDLISQAAQDSTFKVVRHSCFRPDGQSSWPARRSTESLLAEKAGYIQRNQLSIWLAEMECQLTNSENQAFKKTWLRYWNVRPAEGRVAIVLDPAASDAPKADFFAIGVMLFYRGQVYLLEYFLARGVMPDAACAKVFEFAQRYGARDVVVETVAYQKIMAWYLAREIQARRIWLTVHEVNDRRRKDDRIIQAITAVAPYGQLFIREGMAEFEEVFELYGPAFEGKDDLIDMVATGITWHFGKTYSGGDDYEGEFQRLRADEEDLEEQSNWQGAP